MLAATSISLAAPLVALSPPGAAAADTTDPYAPFSSCPTAAVLAAATAHGDTADHTSCLTAVVTGGSFVMGKASVPVTAPSVLQEGSYSDNAGNTTAVAPTDGKLFTSSPMQVPGGLLGVKGTENLLPGLTDVKATVELATSTPPEVSVLNLLYGGGTVATLPIKIHLTNALLGKNCYIGSDKDPIVLNLSVGPTAPPAPNEPITGYRGDIAFQAGPNGGSVIAATGATLVDNSFSVPGATGCGAGGLLNWIVNAKEGLPSAAGHNTAILNQDSYLGGSAAAIQASRG
jgi:hypothetical protein